jgi:diaminopimelate decarboxylase
MLTRRLELFPLNTRLEKRAGKSVLTLNGLNLADLARKYGTPLYVYDQNTMDAAVANYRQALSVVYPAHSGLTYAGKAFLCTAMAQWTKQQSLWLDCTGVGELAIAGSAHVPREHILMHGVSKSEADLYAGFSQAGTLVVDNLDELERLTKIVRGKSGTVPDIWLRLRPGVAVTTHHYRQTGQEDSKFGLSPAEFFQAVRLCRQAGLPLNGLHFHQGSHFHDPQPVATALEAALDLIQEINVSERWLPQTLCPGGGWGVAYHEDELPHPSIDIYVRYVAEQLVEGCARRGLPLPRLQLEPGRSLVARAGVAIYRVEGVKLTAQRRWLLLDGGMADNPRPALYGARYSALPLEESDRPSTGLAWLAGPYCESGDVLINALPMPDIHPGEFVAVPVSGAYHLSMGSNYNGARKPSVLWILGGRASLIQRRETLEDLTRRDLPMLNA